MRAAWTIADLVQDSVDPGRVDADSHLGATP